ncbi:hypothetical protein N329_12045, partial [Haliaeetus albicilla]
EGSVQVLELLAVCSVFKKWDKTPVNIVSDSQYVVGIVKHMHRSLLKIVSNKQLFMALLTLWMLLERRTDLFFIDHIRSHTTLLGFIVESNARADQLVVANADICFNTPKPDLFGQALLPHKFYHQSAKALSKQFDLPLQQARTIIAACPDCANIPNLQPQGVNPWGLSPLQIWQTDVTEYPSFGKYKHIHVSIDTFSNLMWATVRVSTNARSVIKHLLAAFAAMGVPTEIKTDNGPGYRAQSLETFLQLWGVTHNFGIPHNSTGQAIIEHAHRTLKDCLNILKKG